MNLGQVYTRQAVADYMVSLLELPSKARVLEPCYGRGVFVDSLLQLTDYQVCGCEIDGGQLAYRADSDRCQLVTADFFSMPAAEAYDGVIMNPPYVRQEEIDQLRALGVSKNRLRSVCARYHIPSKANLYMYFVYHAISHLKPGGELVVIFPDTWLRTADGRIFRNELQSRGSIVLWTEVKGNPFEGVPLVDVVIMKFVKGRQEPTRYKELLLADGQLQERESGMPVCFGYNQCVSLKQVARVRRGITTGANHLFVNPPVEAPEYMYPLLSSPKSVPGYSTKQAATDSFLAVPPGGRLSDGLRRYLADCRARLEAAGKPESLLRLARKKRDWYCQRLQPAGDIIFPYIIRSNTKFILNDGQWMARDNFYVINSDVDRKLLFGLLNNYFVYLQLENCGKKYGNGLLKIQKYDVDELQIPNPHALSQEASQKIMALAEELLRSDDEGVVQQLSSAVAPFYSIGDIGSLYQTEKERRLFQCAT